MQLGVAKVVITPPMPVRLCGYATRTSTFEGVKEDIFLRVQLHRQEGASLLFLYADLLWWGTDFVKTAREQVSAACGVAARQIFFVASHNHSGPPTGSRFIPLLETYSPAYARFLLERVLEGVRLAAENLEPVEATRHDGACALNVFRRVLADGEIQMRPNYEVPADRALSIVALRRPDGGLKGSMICYPCHANLSDGNVVQPDYPGAALRMLDETFPESVSIFLQGCTADLRPNSVLGDRFISNSYERVLIFAENFRTRCEAVLQTRGVPISPRLHVKQRTVQLPLEGVLTRERLEERLKTARGAELEWAAAVSESGNRATELLELSWIDYGDRLRLYTFGAEVSQYYAAFARELDASAVCVAYTNGMIGYLSTAEQIAQGGYEPLDSALYFALAGTYQPQIEELIHEAMAAIVND